MDKDLSKTNYAVIFVTASSRQEAEAIAQALVADNLAACVSFTQIHSVYKWQGNVNSEDEWQLIIKTHIDKFPQLEAKVKEIHSYEVPEIIALPIVAGFLPYLNWISEQINS
jgi:periplasmic divalent cation tolerance protein